MAGNSQITEVPSTILRNKLGRVAIRLQQQANPLGQNPKFATLESVVNEATKILSKFYKDLSAPGFSPPKIIQDTVPDADVFNDIIQGILDDFNVSFNEFENLEGVILGTFNYMVSRLNRINRKLKSVSSKLGDFILFSDLATKDAIFFSDSFNNLSRVEINSPLLNEDQCEVNQVEGIVTLPIDRDAQVPITITEIPVINSNSNGVPGNNQEINAQLHGNISDILDNNSDTWFEYERVVTSDDGIALTLDFTINMGENKVINFIRVNPNNFGTRTQVEIVAIDTSVDGDKFVSIKDDIPIANFTVEDEENVFTLAPSTSKFAGQGLYTFTPRLAKYVHITLRQKTSYIINTSAGERFRYAIGIRDVEIQALPYKPTGEIISTNYQVNDDISKVVLLANQKPSSESVSKLVELNHFVSPDNGLTWHQIRPKVSAGVANVDQEVPELLDFNGVSPNSIQTTNNVRSLRYKAVMKRNPDAFKDDSEELAQTVLETTELHQPPTTTPFEITLQQQPIDGSLKLIDPQFGSRGKEDVKYNITIGDGNKKIILLPFKPLTRDFQKVESGGVYSLEDLDPQKIFVNGEEWERGALTGSNNRYKLNFEEGKLEFGDGTNGNALPQGSTVSMSLSEERLFPTRGTDHIAKLDYPTSNDKKQVEISILHPPAVHTFVLKKGVKRHELKPDIVFNPSTNLAYTSGEFAIKLSDSNVFGTEKVFIDGNVELVNPKDYSFDFVNGVLYSFNKTSVSADSTIIYSYNPRTVLTDNQWSFVDSDDGIANAVSISDSVYRTFIPDTLTINQVGAKYFNLAHLAIVRGTVVFSGATSGVLDIEVEYIDGRSELLGAIHAGESLDSITGVTAGEVRAIPFKLKISPDTGFSVTFTNQTVFATEVGSLGAVTSVGEYFIDRSAGPTGTIYVKLSGDVLNPGVVNYYYVDPRASLTGRYSINYKTGEVFLHDALTGPVTVDYEYTNIRAKYNIARLVPSDDWEFNSKDKKIVIKDREILKNMRTPQALSEGTIGTSVSKYYQVSYQYVAATRAKASELEPFFSPTLKDYALKVITKSRLV